MKYLFCLFALVLTACKTSEQDLYNKLNGVWVTDTNAISERMGPYVPQDLKDNLLKGPDIEYEITSQQIRTAKTENGIQQLIGSQHYRMLLSNQDNKLLLEVTKDPWPGSRDDPEKYLWVAEFKGESVYIDMGQGYYMWLKRKGDQMTFPPELKYP